MSVTARSELGGELKIVVDAGGALHFVSRDAKPGLGGYPDGWMPLEDLLAQIENDALCLLIEGMLQKQIETDERLRNAFSRG